MVNGVTELISARQTAVMQYMADAAVNVADNACKIASSNNTLSHDIIKSFNDVL